MDYRDNEEFVLKGVALPFYLGFCVLQSQRCCITGTSYSDRCHTEIVY